MVREYREHSLEISQTARFYRFLRYLPLNLTTSGRKSLDQENLTTNQLKVTVFKRNEVVTL